MQETAQPASDGEDANWLQQLLQLPFLMLARQSQSGSGGGSAAAPLVYWPPRQSPQLAEGPPEHPDEKQQRPEQRKAAASLRSPSGGGGSVDVLLTASFISTSSYDFVMRLPPSPPRSMAVQVLRYPDGAVESIIGDVPYAVDQTIGLQVPPGRYTVELHDSDDDALVLYSSEPGALDASSGGGTLELSASIKLQPVELQARFTKLAWAGGRYVAPNEAVDANIAVIGAKMTVWTRGPSGPFKWFSRFTDEEGYALFFLPPGSSEFFANFTLGDVLLASQQLAPAAWQGEQPDKAPVQTVDADRKLLCTGDLEEVRAPRGSSAGSFPPNNAAGAYTPLNFACRWALIPPVAGSLVTLDVDFSAMLPGESLVLYLDPSSTVVLSRGCCGGQGRFMTAVVVDSSIPIEFKTGDRPDRKVGGFRIDWHSQERPEGGAGFQPQEVMIIVIAIAASALLALAFCAYCARRHRSRRDAAAAALPGAAGGPGGGPPPAARRCPTPVRRLLPVKPYVPPGHNPLPGAVSEAEVDCCSICLVEFDPGESVTVLPCRHFYHGECINGWLKRNCTCPLCKADVLQAVQALAVSGAFQTGASRASQSHRNSRGSAAAAAAAVAAAAAAAAPLEEEEDAVTVSVIVNPRGGGGGDGGVGGGPISPASAGRPSGQEVWASSRAASRRSSGAGAGATVSPTGGAPAPVPGAAQAGRADASAGDFMAAAAAAAALAVAPDPAGSQAAGAGGAEGGGGIELQSIRVMQALSRRVLGAIRGGPLPRASQEAGAPASGGEGELSGAGGRAQLPGSTGAGSPSSASAGAGAAPLPAPAFGAWGTGAPGIGGAAPAPSTQQPDSAAAAGASPLPLQLPALHASPSAFPNRTVAVYAYAGERDPHSDDAPELAAPPATDGQPC